MKAKFLLETIDNADAVFNMYMEDPKFRMSIIKTAFDNGCVVHGTDSEFTNFDKNYVGGGVRANYGYGFYFTDSITKYADYGSDPSKYKFCDITSFELLDLKTTPAKLGMSSILDLSLDLKAQLHRVNDMLDNARSNADYSYYSDIKDSLESQIDRLDSQQGMYDSLIDRYISDNKTVSFESINKRVASSVPRNIEKEISNYYAKIGFDGFVYDFEYVIFNYDKLNANLVKDIKAFVYKMSQLL